jgi:hypothetical protein
MPITTEKKVVARCDLEACTAVRYGTDAVPPVGFRATIERITEDAAGVVGHTVQLYGCSLAHLKKAAEDYLDDPSHHGVQTYEEPRTATDGG